jgi:hypothetical protein
VRGGNTRSTSRQSSQRSLKRLVPERVRRRARRRRVLWALVVLVVVAGFVLLAWPAPPRHLYTQTVQIGQKHADSKQLAFDAADVTRPPAIGQIVDAVNASPSVEVAIHTTSSRRRVNEAADVVRATAQVIAPARAEAEVAATDGLVRAQRQRLVDAETRLAEWRTAKGYDDPNQEVATLEAELARATSTGATGAAVGQIQERLFAARSAIAGYTALTAARDTAGAGLQSANTSHTRAVAALNDVRTRATANVVISPVTTRTGTGPRPFWPVATAVILQVLAIIAADVLFLTRAKFVPQSDDDTTGERHKRKKELRQDRRAPRHGTRTRTRTRTRSGRVEAQPLDLPNLEVHFIGQEGGQRAVELRDVPGGSEDPPPHRPEQ